MQARSAPSTRGVLRLCRHYAAGRRALVRVNGKTISERQAGSLVGTQGAAALARLGFDAVPTARKGRYFAFRGARAERQRLRAIAHLIAPYPKRDVQ
jgi:hypothetical protein